MAVGPERTKRHPNRASIPASAVCARDKAQLVDTCDESAKEAQIDECDEDCGAFCCGEADEGIDGPEDGDYADDEEDQDVGWCELVCFEVAVDKVGLCGWR